MNSTIKVSIISGQNFLQKRRSPALPNGFTQAHYQLTILWTFPLFHLSLVFSLLCCFCYSFWVSFDVTGCSGYDHWSMHVCLCFSLFELYFWIVLWCDWMFWLWPTLAGRHVKTNELIWQWGASQRGSPTLSIHLTCIYSLKNMENIVQQIWKIFFQFPSKYEKYSNLAVGSQPERISHLLYSSHLYIFSEKSGKYCPTNMEDILSVRWKILFSFKIWREDLPSSLFISPS